MQIVLGPQEPAWLLFPPPIFFLPAPPNGTQGGLAGRKENVLTVLPGGVARERGWSAPANQRPGKPEGAWLPGATCPATASRPPGSASTRVWLQKRRPAELSPFPTLRGAPSTPVPKAKKEKILCLRGSSKDPQKLPSRQVPGSPRKRPSAPRPANAALSNSKEFRGVKNRLRRPSEKAKERK